MHMWLLEETPAFETRSTLLSESPRRSPSESCCQESRTTVLRRIVFHVVLRATSASNAIARICRPTIVWV
jgi:hypothetical protein